MDLLRILDDKPAPSIVDAKTLGVSGNTSGDYWLPTTMCLHQKELTDQIVSLHYSDILRYFETIDFKEDVVLNSMETMCRNSALVATHPFLLIDHFLPKSLITRDIPAYLSETSGKFTVLRDLITLVQEYETNTAIVCQSGLTMDLVEALLLGSKVDIKRYDGNSIKSKQKKHKKVAYSCTVHLFPSKDWDTKKHPIDKKLERFDMLIAVDPTVNTDNKDMMNILTHARKSKTGDSRAPIVRLVAINSLDHCDLYFRKKYEKSSKEYLESVTAAVVVLRDRVGVLPPDLRPIYNQHLGYLLEWLEDPSLPWPLPDVYTIKHFNSMDVERSLLSEVNYNQNDDLDSAFSSNNKKRTRGRPQLNSSKDSYSSTSSGKNGANYTPSFYETKRLKNDYSKNPTKQGKGILTGIISSDESMGANYHLSSDILTHKLIQSMGQVYFELERQKEEIQMYNDVNPIEEKHVEFYTAEDDKIKTKFDNCIDLTTKSKMSYTKLELENKEYYSQIEELEAQLDGKFKALVSKWEDSQKLKDLISKSYDLVEEIDKETRKGESKLIETQYMEKEIDRAVTSINDSTTSMANITTECQKMEEDLRMSSEKFRTEKEEVIKKIVDLKDDIEAEKKIKQSLESTLEILTKDLKKIPVQRIRPSNNKRHYSRRR